jgi:arginase
MLNNKSLYLLGYASGIAGAVPESGRGPMTLKNSSYFSPLLDQHIDLNWENIFEAKEIHASILSQVTDLCGRLAEATAKLTTEKKSFIVFGGDHSSAIGTWSGAAYAKRAEGDLGLIWIDAHMDSHTPETSPSGNLHGMPVACLLGHGNKSLTEICDALPKIKPENICLIGIRSYEPGEADLLKKLNVKIFYMDEVLKRGMAAVLKDAVTRVTRNTINYGITIDIDSMDPEDAPGTGVAEPGGIAANDLCSALTNLVKDSRLIGVEIAEFDPTRDRDHITEHLVTKLVSAVTLGKY